MAKFGLRSAASVASWSGGVRRAAGLVALAAGVLSAAVGRAAPAPADEPRRSLLSEMLAEAQPPHEHGSGACLCGREALAAIERQLDLDAAREGEDPAVRRARFRAWLRTSSTCFVRNPTPEQIRLIAERFGGRNPSEGAAGINNRFFLDFSAWDGNAQTVTQTTGQAKRIRRLTYSFPEDGTVWQRFNPLAPPPGYETCPNDLNFRFESRFGAAGRDYGRELFRQALAAWKYNCGVDYAEVCDDNAPLTLNLEPASARRGDIRFGACPQGTGFGILAFNFYPEFGGDMTLNSDYFTPFDYWSGGGSGQYRYLRNAIAHEHGHGLGFRHVVPCSETKLMEPFASVAYDMIQRDERRGAQHNYGDRYAGNHTPATARELNLRHVISLNNPPGDPRYGSSGTNFRRPFALDHNDPAAGILPQSAIERELSTNGAVCDGCADPTDLSQVTNPTGQDFFTFSLEHDYPVVITVDPTGGSYANGPQGNMPQQDPCEGTITNILAENAGNLNVQLFSVDPVTLALTEIRPGQGAMAPAGMNERLDAGLLPPGRYVIRVYDVGPNPIALPNGDTNPDGSPAVQRMPTQLYDLMVRLGDPNQPGAQLPYPPLAIAGVDKVVRVSIPPAGTDPGQPSIMSFIGDVSSRVQEPGLPALSSRVEFWEWDLDGDGEFEINADDFNNPPMGEPRIDPRAPFAVAPTDNRLIPVTLRVTDSLGRRATDTIYVKVTGAPIVVTGVTPMFGTQNSTVPISITGTGLGAVTDAAQIVFDGLGVTCVGVPRSNPSGTLLTGIAARIDITAALGFRSITVGDGCTVSNTLADAFEVRPQVPPPPQDACAGAIRWPDDFGDKAWDNIGATTDPGNQNYPGTPCAGEIIDGDVWYFWQVPECTSSTISATVVPPPGMDVRLAVYRLPLGIPPPIGCPPLAALAACGSTPNFPLVIPVLPGELLLFRMGGATPGQTGMGIVRLGVNAALGACCNAGVCRCVEVNSCLGPGDSWIAGEICSPNPCPGVCCLVNGECRLNLTQAACAAAGPNSAWRTGTTCAPNPCPQLGACCFGTGCSAMVYDTPCADAGGRFLGRDTTCAPVNNCGGACCRLDGSCDFTTAGACFNTQGNYSGDGTVCTPNTCPQPGACCFGTSCNRVLASVCTGPDARFLGENSACQPTTCDPGACCDNGACIIVIAASCQHAGATFIAPNTTCAPDPCDPGACCDGAGRCTFSAGFECSAAAGLTFLGAGVACDPVACLRGACCGGMSGTECTQEFGQICADSSRRFAGPATTCQPNACVGACCTSGGSCSLVVPSLCSGQGVSFLGGGTSCSPNPCPQPGACCRGTTCQVSLGSACTGGGATFLGAMTACTPGACSTGACCDNGACIIRLGGRCTDAGQTFVGAGTTCAPDPCDPGACCSNAGVCTFRAGFECTAAMGLTFLGAGVACDPVACIRGACCAGASCAQEFAVICSDSGRRFIAPAAACGPNPCVGACCSTTTGACVLRTPDACTGAGVNYRGDGTACTPVICGVGACCVGGACETRPQAQCTGAATFLGVGTTCVPSACAVGACCTGTDCVDTLQALCTAPGSRFIAGEPCSAMACVPGACCNAAACTLTIAADCPTVFTQPGTTCTQTACQFGACCEGSACTDTLGALCTSPTARFISGEPCSAMACVPGACCVGTTCSLVVAADCAGTFNGVGTACTPLLCDVVGACCLGTSCTVAIQTNCGNAGGIFQGVGVACGTMANPTTCCPANIDRVGGVAVQDIFNYLDLWFTQDPRAEFDGQPGITLDDLFTFLAAWFAGCETPGACCEGAVCTILTSTACTNRGGVWTGAGSACGTSPTNPTTCCRANINGIDGVTPQDIFDYLALYLTGSPLADINGDGAIAIDDLFTFLALYFIGCS